MMKRLSIVIVTYNSTKDIDDCLNSIFQYNDIGDSLEVIVVDNNSNDIDLLRSILSRYNSVRLIENTFNGGYGRGNNLGIKMSSSPIIMVMNPDVRLIMPLFRKVIECFSVSNNLALLGMKQYETIGRVSNSFLPISHSLFNFIIYITCKKMDLYTSKYLFISGACFFLDKKKFDNIGLFDENIFMYSEEFDINRRIRAHGYDIRYDHNIGYVHPMHQRIYNEKSEEDSFCSFIYTRNKYKIDIIRELNYKIRFLYIYLLYTLFSCRKVLRDNTLKQINYYKRKKKLVLSNQLTEC